MTVLVVALIVLLAYFLGSIPFGLIIARMHGVDIRAQGSGNIGATNVWRVLGKKAGLTTFLLDAGKGWLSVVAGAWLATRFAPGLAKAPADVAAFAGIAGALGCILGHSFPIWLGFKGGKGVATSLGVIIGMMPLVSLIVFAIWAIVFKVSKYVSLASIIGAITLPLVTLAALFLGWVQGWALFYFSLAAALLVIRRHRDNIKRLMAGTENRFGSRKTEAHAEELTSENVDDDELDESNLNVVRAIRLARSASAGGTKEEQHTLLNQLAAHCTEHRIDMARVIRRAGQPDEQ